MNYGYNEDKMLEGIRAFREEQRNAPPPVKQSRYNLLPYNMRVIVRTVSRHFGVDAAEILSDCREPNLVLARWIVIYLARQQKHTYAAIGRFIGRHHTTVIYAERQANEYYEHHPAFREALDAIRKKAA